MQYTNVATFYNWFQLTARESVANFTPSAKTTAKAARDVFVQQTAYRLPLNLTVSVS